MQFDIYQVVLGCPVYSVDVRFTHVNQQQVRRSQLISDFKAVYKVSLEMKNDCF
ncbi:hypothetical protein EV682_103317 [Iodobacter fluviatilis]|uniref:Uncharacterized protein n=1 Tax=Iodobacter fluviatilis TaxID=537 RepID=A0A377Q7F8_9NEIS|nr:hypothetical protein EV682_103317 [Iodobacter fluviatilis]STQ91196.1 Uncharacterised protein [Iodobacter fluviatilis]